MNPQENITCAICLGSVAAGRGQAIFLAECSHSFHFSCIGNSVAHGNHLCPLCRAPWNDLPFIVPTLNARVLSYTNSDNSPQARVARVSTPAVVPEPVQFSEDDSLSTSNYPLSVVENFWLASIDSFDSNWKQFLEPGESVLMTSTVKKRLKLTSKKVQLILTNKPKLLYIDPAKLLLKSSIIWSDNPNELNVQVTSPSKFKICTPNKVLSIKDAKQRGHQWKQAIEELQNL